MGDKPLNIERVDLRSAHVLRACLECITVKCTTFCSNVIILSQAGTDHPLSQAIEVDRLISGFPGTQQTALLALSDHLVTFSAAFKTYAQTLQTDFIHTVRLGMDQRPEADKSMKAVSESIHRLHAVLSGMLPSVGKPEKFQKPIAGFLATGLAKGSLSQGDAKKLDDLLKQLRNDRLDRKAVIGPYEKVLAQSKTVYDSFLKSTDRVVDHALTCAMGVANVISTMHVDLASLATSLNAVGEAILRVSEEIDFKSDFRDFVEGQRIIRYDLACEPFKPIDLSHPVFADLDTRIQDVVPPLYPVGLAAVVDDFQSAGANEMSCIKGKYVLLMEEIADVWVFVQNPNTRAMGYVPAASVKAVAPVLAIVLRQPDGLPDDVYIEVGAYVAVTAVDGPHADTVTIRGESVRLPREILGIIYQ
jgi:hypothetical protein